jgi:Concanavalin A-like lectin/glucanases superfamily
VTGPPSGGQLLSPNWNGVQGAPLNPIFVNGARPPVLNQPTYTAQPQAGYGGDIWGAYGGGVTPVGGGVSGPGGYDLPVATTLANAETPTNYVLTGYTTIIQPPGIPPGGSVISIIHFADSGNTFTDSAIPSNLWTAGGTNGTATEVASPSEFPPAGSLFISGFNAYINTPYVAGGTLDLTHVPNWSIDLWVYPTPATITNASNHGLSTIFDFSAGFSTMLRLYATSSGQLQIQGFGATGLWNNISITTVAAMTVNAWNHVVVQRIGLTMYFGLNGVLLSDGGFEITGNAAAIPANQFAYIGASNNSGGGVSTGWDMGYIDEHRIVSGAALFGTGTSYTIPVGPGGNPVIGILSVNPPPNQNMLSQESTGAMPASTFDDTLPTGGSNQG